ncbi:hypothetical protein CIPAW_16G112600 [Carya illinoinensis]|uniref:TIR domain-containing protein n=2 Tax=Carya illinoinensis TaxID=32201 RepID=A0A8T1N832_CARIL|nr:hypothetical protein CIPAW_16G112600 [Carya illinoinensis]
MAFRLPDSSSASSSSALKWSFDVFLSFRGIDTRNNFTAHLYQALLAKGIKTYRDDTDLERAEGISPGLLKAIEESMIFIIILSPNYASSTWCLEELTKILECKETKQQIVLPVFYHVDPSDVRNLKESFGEALAKHHERFQEDPKVQRWKESLREVATLAGLHLAKDGNEYEFMQEIVKWVDLRIFKSRYEFDIAEHPIGLESRLKDLITNLEIGRNDITLMIGIYGIGGIGKTTLAKAIFNSIGRHFEARCFLKDVRENSSQQRGLVKMQENLLYELLGSFESSHSGSSGGINVIKRRLCSKRVLIILDDVNESRQLNELAGNHNWFGPGSRIVITTRDQHVLTYHPVDSTYEVQGLDNNQAIQLFNWHAFKRDKPDESYVQLTKCIIGYAKGLPLALIVLGSDLTGRTIDEWKNALEKYERNIHKGIYEILKISYDGLDNMEKDIFLDIACFFKGKSLEYVMKILEGCGFSSYFGIARLKDKCLINIRNQCVEMHDLLQEMGREIVQRESPKEAGKRSRLWFHKDIRDVLEENTGTNTIEGILLDFPEGDDKICLHSKTFENMRNLRLFINRNAQFSAGPNYLSNKLRVIDWPEYPSSVLPHNFHGNNLVEFEMPNSRIKELGGLISKNLTYMDLRYCKFITKIPDLSRNSNLESLDLGDCENLVEVHHSVGFLEKLCRFSVSGCCKLRILPKGFKLRSLRFFDFKYCWCLEEFPEIECEMEFLAKLDFQGTSIKKLHSSIENLKGLKRLDLYGSSLKELPSSIGNLTRLEELHAAGSSSSAIWKSLQVSNFFPALVELDISGSDIVIFPAQGVRFASLRHLLLNNCKKLEEILPIPLSISTVEARECTSLKSFALLSDILILIKNSGTIFSNFLRIDLYRCHKLCANMRPISSCEERHSTEQNRVDHFEDRYIDIIFPGNRIPSWFSYSKEAHDSNLCEIDINQPHHWNDKDEIVLYVVLGFRVGITDPIMDNADITVKIHDRSDWEDLYTRDVTFSWTDSDHVWMLWMSYGKEVDVSRFRFECKSEFVVFRRVGIHFLKKHEENVRDEDITGDEGGDCWLDFMDEKRHSSISYLENDNKNSEEDFYCGAIFNFLRCGAIFNFLRCLLPS